MTLTEYDSLVGQVRYHFSALTNTLINRKRLSAAYDLGGPIDEQAIVVGYYLDVLEEYFLPAIVLGTVAVGDTKITLTTAITPSDYDRYIGHVIEFADIDNTTTLYITRFDEDYIYLSGAVSTTASNIEITLGENCLSLDQMRCVIGDINRILGTNLCKEVYWTEYDLNAALTDVSTNILLTGSSGSVLTGANIYASLDKSDAPSGDTDVLFNFTLNYPYFAYSSTIADLTQILDQEGDDVLASGAFSQSLLNVTFPGVATTSQYKVYTTGYITTINNKTYQFKF